MKITLVGNLTRLLIVAAALALAGCATTGASNPRDPVEPFNRSMFAFNDGLDKVVLKPVVSVYTTVFPQFFRTGVSNFFSNIGDVWVGVNNLLQGKPGQAVSDIGRVVVNSTVGLLGFIDVATDMGLKPHNEDFGQTLAVWGVDGGAYLVLPVFGPRTVRDSFGLAADLYANPVGHISYVPTRNTIEGVQFLDARANLTDASNLLDTAALDRYTFVRESYLQRRRNLIYDGDPPPLPPAKDEDDTPEPAKKVPPSTAPATAPVPQEKRSAVEPDSKVAAVPRSVAYPVAIAALPDVIAVQPAEGGIGPVVLAGDAVTAGPAKP